MNKMLSKEQIRLINKIDGVEIVDLKSLSFSALKTEYEMVVNN